MQEEIYPENALVFVDDAHTFGGAQIALGWAIRAVLRLCQQPVACVCTAATCEAIKEITGEDKNLRFIECPPALSLNIFSFPFRLWSFYRLLTPLVRCGVRRWWFNLAGIEFCLAPLLILRWWGLYPVAWLHNTESLEFYNANKSLPRKVLSRVRDAVATRSVFGLYRWIVTPSQATETLLKARFCGSPPPLTGFLYPIAGLRTAREEIKQKETSPTPIDIWMIGRVEFGHKNNLAGLEVLKHLRCQQKTASLTVVGNGPDMELFWNATNELGLSDFVRFKKWEKNPWGSVPESAIVLIPSFFEGMPLVATEAMLQGGRLVTSPIAAFVEGIPNEMIARDFSTEAFVEKIEEITAMSQERVLALYAPALNKFTEEAFVAKFQTILQAASGKSLSTVKASSSGETT